MPVLSKILISNFRNIEFAELEFSANVNCICGNNGEGKTNLLDAIHYLSMTKSAFSVSDRYNFKYGADAFSVCGIYAMPSGISSKVSIEVNQHDKLLRRDDKICKKMSSHIGQFPLVMISPSDISLVSESGEERRRFVNAVLSQIDPSYLANLQQYNKYLLQRNHLLKEPGADQDLLDVIDERMAALSVPVWEKRREFALQLSPVVQECYEQISSGGEKVSLCYVSDLDRSDPMELFRASREKDRILRYTTVGVQRDDLKFEIDGHPIRNCGSQGQQKSFLVALKFAQYDIMKESCGFPPILLLDDVFDKLDMERISSLIRMVASSDFGQIFISDTNVGRMRGLVEGFTEDHAFFVTKGGCFNK